MKTFALHILSPDRTFYDGECESLVLPIVDGKYGIMADHSNTIAAVVPGELSYRTPAERPEEIAASRARAAADAAREAMLQKLSRREYYEMRISLARAMTRLRVTDRSEQ